MRGLALGLVGLALAAGLPGHGQTGERLLGAWLQTAPAWSVTADNPWTVMIFNSDGTFCGGSAKDRRYAEGTYGFDGELLTTIGGSGRLSERTVAFGARGTMTWDDPQIDEPVSMVRTDMFADCAALRAHQGQ
jgi:hypothetical protein